MQFESQIVLSEQPFDIPSAAIGNDNDIPTLPLKLLYGNLCCGIKFHRCKDAFDLRHVSPNAFKDSSQRLEMRDLSPRVGIPWFQIFRAEQMLHRARIEIVLCHGAVEIGHKCSVIRHSAVFQYRSALHVVQDSQ